VKKYSKIYLTSRIIRIQFWSYFLKIKNMAGINSAKKTIAPYILAVAQAIAPTT
jgi:hypothetical protein